MGMGRWSTNTVGMGIWSCKYSEMGMWSANTVEWVCGLQIQWNGYVVCKYSGNGYVGKWQSGTGHKMDNIASSLVPRHSDTLRGFQG